MATETRRAPLMRCMITPGFLNAFDPVKLLRSPWLLERPEKLRQQERLEAVAADGDDLLLLRVQRDAGGAGEADAGSFDDRPRRDVAVIIRRIDGDESHLVQTPRVAVIVFVVFLFLLRLE